MSGPPPPYPGNTGMYPPQEKSPYPPQPCAPPPAGYPQQAYPPPPPGNIHPPGYGPPPPGYGPPQPAGYGPPPPMGQPGMYGPPPGPPPTTVIVQPAIHRGMFSDNPIQTRCPKCSADIMTSTYYETGTLSWILCLILCFFGFIFGCCLIPFCIDSTKDVVHTCPNCNQQIGRYNRM